jgi:hypothetical protein
VVTSVRNTRGGAVARSARSAVARVNMASTGYERRVHARVGVEANRPSAARGRIWAGIVLGERRTSPHSACVPAPPLKSSSLHSDGAMRSRCAREVVHELWRRPKRLAVHQLPALDELQGDGVDDDRDRVVVVGLRLLEHLGHALGIVEFGLVHTWSKPMWTTSESLYWLGSFPFNTMCSVMPFFLSNSSCCASHTHKCNER